MSVVNTEGCLIVPDSFNRIRSAVFKWANKSGHGFHHKRSHKGFLRSLVLRRGERTGEILVNLVTTSEETLDEVSFCEAVVVSIRDFSTICDRDDTNLRETIGFSQQDKEHRSIQIVGILHTINDRRSDVVACDSYKTLYGRDHYFEELMGLTFKVGAFSFFQTNTSAVESMLNEALAMIPDKHTQTLYDVYCGTGTISLSLSKRAETVVGIELSEDSVISARENAIRNGIANTEFICGDAFEVMSDLPAPDMIVVDPPRMGLHPKALKRILEFDLPIILYISCNPKTFAENAAVLKNAGYGISILGAYDNFPYTRHIELAALMQKQLKKPFDER
jgi:tRNA/tmRNA/rRNA uracil-C5-methylase (TrmA/RlmC/RlmD family)